MITNSELYQKLIYKEIKDRTPFYHKLQADINLLSSEILRLCRLPYRSWKNQDKIRTLDKQIEYLEHLLSKFEHNQKQL